MENNEVMIKELAVINTAGNILTTNLLRVDKGVANGTVLASQWAEAEKIADVRERLQVMAAIDDSTNSYLAACGKVIKELKANREPVTQMMAEYAKKFTSAENKLDRTNTASVAYQLQLKRNEYATAVANFKKQAEEEARKAAALELAKSNYKIDVITRVTSFLNEQVAAKKASINTYVNCLTLDIIDEAKNRLASWNDTISGKFFAAAISEVTTKLGVTDRDDLLAEIFGIDIAVSQQYLDMAASYTKQVKEYIAVKLDDFVGIKAELEATAKRAEEARIAAEEAAKAQDLNAKRAAEAKATEAKAAEEKAKAEKIEREKLEAAKLAEEKAKAEAKAEQDSKIAKEGEAALASFNTIANTQVIPDEPETRSGYEIEVTHISGYAQLIALWFETEAPKVALDKVANMKIEAIVKWAAKLAHGGGAKVQSQFVKYNEVHKAVNRK